MSKLYIGFRDAEGHPTSPLPKQDEFQQWIGACVDNLYAGSLGVGKTEVQVLEAVMQSWHYPKNLGLMGRKVLDAFKKSTLIQLLDMAGDFVKRHSPQDHEIEFLNGSKIVYMALDDSRDAIQRIKSMNLGFFSFDQLEEIPQDTFRAAKGQLRRGRSSRTNFHACNPGGHDWVWQKFKRDEAKNRSQRKNLVEARTWQKGVPPPTCQEDVETYSDNPYLPFDYIRELLLDHPQKWINRYVYCEWDDFAGLVYPEFDEKVHFVSPKTPIEDWWNHYIVYDYGRTNPSAILFAAVDTNGTIYCYDGIYAEDTPIYELAKILEEKTKDSVSYEYLADPSIRRSERDGMSVADEWEEYDITWDNARNDKRAGFERVSKFLYFDRRDDGYFRSKPKLYFLDKPELEPLRNEILDYKWAELKFGTSTRPNPEDAVKRNDHFMDTVRYLVHAVEDAKKRVKKYEHYRQPKTRNGFMGV